MNGTFVLQLYSESASERIDNVVSFVGMDESGSFGILAHREPLATILIWGLCSYRTSDGARLYIAMPSGVLYFANSVLRIESRRYLRAEDGDRVLVELQTQMRAEAASTQAMHAALKQLDRELLRRLLALQ